MNTSRPHDLLATPHHHDHAERPAREVPAERRGWMQRVVTPAPPLLMAALVAKLWLTGTLQYYVNSRTVWTVLLGGVLFALIGTVGAVRALRRPSDAHLSWQTLVFLVPAVLGLLLPARPLSAASGQASSLGALQLASHVSSGTPGDNFASWVSALSAHPDAGWWRGQHVTLVGFVASEPGLPRRGFIVGRYIVTCCVVDATLLGFPVQLARGRVPREGSWVQVSGTFAGSDWTDTSGGHYPLIEHARITPVTIPSSPYLSP